MPYRPHISIQNHLDRGTLPLFENPLYKMNGSSYAEEEFERCKDLFKNKLPDEYGLSEEELLRRSTNLFNNAYVMISRLEKRFKSQLEQLAIDTIKEIYDVPEHVVLQAKLKSGIDDIDFDEQQDVKIPNVSKERMEYIEEEIQKRIILNGLVHGSSMYVWKTAHYIVVDNLNKLDDKLMDLYNRYIAIVSFYLWKVDTSSHSMAQGINKVEFEKQNSPEASIKSEAINFPVLLHEVNKGIIDYLICRAIPKDFTEEELKYYYARADKYSDEIFHYLLSPTLWKDLLDAIKAPTQKIPDVIAKLSLLKLDELVEFFDAVHNNKENVKITLKRYGVI